MQKIRRVDFRHILMAAVSLCALSFAGCTNDGSRVRVFQYGQNAGAGSTGIHTIIPGDTVGGLAQRYNLVLRDILVVNNLEAPYILQPGQRLKLPAPRSYKVRGRDTIPSVARLFGTSQSQLVRLNNLSAPYALKRGQILKLPVVEDQPGSGLMASSSTISIAPVAPGDGDAITRPTAMNKGGIEREELAPPEVTGTAVPAPAAAQAAKPALAAKVPDKTPARAGTKFMKPIDGPILSSYGPKPGGLHNDGINIKAPQGAPVRAAENGVVVYAGSMKGYGNMVLVRHADRWMTAYAHLDRILVERGATISRGSTIGTVGRSGTVDQPQLHFEIRRGTDALNPEKYM